MIIVFAVLMAAPVLCAQTRQERLKEHVYYFASDSLQGRGSCTTYAHKAAEYISGQYAEAGVLPLFEDGWMHRFTIRGGTTTDNVVGIIVGNDPELQSEFIVVGAHFDHLGVKSNGEVYNGADDNASGSAAVIEIARELAARQSELKRSVIVAGFDAEELGLYGSTALANTLDSLIGRDNIKLMLSIDMVGWYGKSGYLEMEGTSTIKDGRKLILADAEKYGLNLKLKNFETSVFTATDTEGFARKGIPTLAVSTGLKSPYHKPEDDADLIDYQGLDTITAYLADLICDISGDQDYAPSGKVAAKHGGKSRVLEAGIIAGIGDANIAFPDAAVNGKADFAWSAGVMAKFNLARHFGLAISALSESTNAKYPSTGSVYSPASVYNQKALTVPAMALLNLGSARESTYFGVGPYYSRPLSSTLAGSAVPWTVNPDQWGIQFGWGSDVAGVTMGLDFRWQCNDLFVGEGAPNARLNTFNFHIGYLF